MMKVAEAKEMAKAVPSAGKFIETGKKVFDEVEGLGAAVKPKQMPALARSIREGLGFRHRPPNRIACRQGSRQIDLATARSWSR